MILTSLRNTRNKGVDIDILHCNVGCDDEQPEDMMAARRCTNFFAFEFIPNIRHIVLWKTFAGF
ncbi:hypothetical protein CO151_07755 [bacterium CG_4_9_14_3_um_filter_65_15]|nr:MAG: hypothetical protein CO151_07755 [bacterium CG_4_9_14_3_um_filter_65_15]